MKIIGIDICKDRAVCWSLESVPTDVKAYWRRESKKRSKDPKKDQFTYYFTGAGIAGLLALKPDAIALEPTGMHYSYLIAHVCQREKIGVLWVGHQQAVSYRKQNNLPDKNDLADAMAIACYAHIYFPLRTSKCNMSRLCFRPSWAIVKEMNFLKIQSKCDRSNRDFSSIYFDSFEDGGIPLFLECGNGNDKDNNLVNEDLGFSKILYFLRIRFFSNTQRDSMFPGHSSSCFKWS